MGGPGSGSHFHWWRGDKKTAVEDCLSIDASRWSREGILNAAAHHTGWWRWTYASGNAFCVSYEVNTRDPDDPRVRLSYSWASSGKGEVQSADYDVRLTRTFPKFGGVRWWFVCPLVVGGRPCVRRAGKLHLPGYARYFGCRRCYDLTYRSCQESHQFDRAYQRLALGTGLDWREVKRALSRPREP